MSSTNKKGIFWLIGLIISLVLYILIKTQPIFSFLNDLLWLPLAIILIIIVLFLIIGQLISRVPIEFLIRSKKLKFNDIEKKVNLIYKKEDIDNFSKNLRNIFNYISKENYSKESIKIFSDFVGLDKKTTNNLLQNSKKLKFVKLIYWIIGFILCILNYVLIVYLPYFEFLENIWFLPYSISLIIFILFFAEGLFAVRMPASFYLNILDISRNKYLENQKEIINKSDILKDYKTQQKVAITRIKNTIAYLKKMNIKDEDIEKLLNKEGFSKNTSKELIKYSLEKMSQISKLPNTSSDKVLELFLSKIHEEFISLKDIYEQLNKINVEIYDIKKNQSQLKSFTSKSTSNNKVKTVVNNNSDDNDIDVKKKDSSFKKVKNKILINKAKALINKDKTLNVDDKKVLEKNLEAVPNSNKYSSLIDFLFNLLKPYVSKYTKKEIYSFLLSEQYATYIIDDVITKFKDNKISFAAKSRPLSEKFVYFVNNMYNKISKNN
jgi:hypothetical protein